jgi:hypothetical protein
MRLKLFILTCLLVLAGVLRFCKLGEWSFAKDETATLWEEASLFLGVNASPDSQIFRLPRIVPLSHFLLHVGYTLFGRDEFGSRVVPAILGTASVGAVFLLLDALTGRSTASATSLLIALWPAHIVLSQENRFYMIAFFFSSLCLLVGALAAKRRSAILGLAACCLAIAAGLSHTISFAVLLVSLLALVSCSMAPSRPPPRIIVLIYFLAILVVAGFATIYLKPLVKGWNEGSSFGYTVPHSILASILMFGWPVVILAGLGGLLLLYERSLEGWYWVTCALSWAIMTAALPLVVHYHPSYSFPLALCPMVLAGSAVATVFESLRRNSVLIGAAWLIGAAMLNLPSLVSHYIDGSRPDMRSAAHYVRTNWTTGDRVTGPSMGLFLHYASGSDPVIPLSESDPVPQLQRLAQDPGRLWIVIQSGRSGLPDDLSVWLGKRCSHEFKVRRRRFDYEDNCVDVYKLRG